MKTHNMTNARGMTMIGFLIVLVVVGFFAFIGMKLFPVYSEYYGVRQAMKALEIEPGSASYDSAKIRDSLDRKFYISYVTSVKPENIKIKKVGGGTNVSINYEVREPLIYNLDFVAKFEKSVELKRQ